MANNKNVAKYEIAVLAKKAEEIFNTTPEVVTVALSLAGNDPVELTTAKDTVKAFLEKEVQ